MDEPVTYQFDDALWVGFFGGYGMYVDNLDASPEFGPIEPRTLPAAPDYEAVLCKTCADTLLDAAPWIRVLLTGP